MTDEEKIARQIKDQANESIRALLKIFDITGLSESCLLYTSPSPRD